MTPTPILNARIVGLGRMENHHASNSLRLVPRARLLCVCTPAPPGLKWVEEHLAPHGVQVHTSFEEMLAVKDLKAVVIAPSTKSNRAKLGSPLHSRTRCRRLPRVPPRADGPEITGPST